MEISGTKPLSNSRRDLNSLALTADIIHKIIASGLVCFFFVEFMEKI